MANMKLSRSRKQNFFVFYYNDFRQVAGIITQVVNGGKSIWVKTQGKVNMLIDIDDLYDFSIATYNLRMQKKYRI